MIQDFVDIYPPLNETYLPLFATEKGKNVYEETLGAVKKQFPQYVREIEGTADGANIPFHKVCPFIQMKKKGKLIDNKKILKKTIVSYVAKFWFREKERFEDFINLKRRKERIISP